MTRNAFALSQLESEQLPEHLTYAAKLRAAAAKAVSEQDITEIVQGLVKRAKEGDAKATQFLFDAVLGAKQPLTLKQVNYYHEEPRENTNGHANGSTNGGSNGKPAPARLRPVKPAKAPRLDSNHSPLSNASLQTTADIVAYLRIHGPSLIVDVAPEIGITPRQCRELARQSADIEIQGDTLHARKERTAW